jgi:hypothetical protein
MKYFTLPVFVLSLCAASASAQNLLLNASFETGSTFIPSIYTDRMPLPNGSTVINNWVVGNAAGNFWWLRSPSYNPQDGARAIDLDSNGLTPFTFIEQTFSTTIGQQYQVSGYFSSEGNGGPAQTSVLINGNLLGSVTAGSGVGEVGPGWTDLVWKNASFLFTATSTSSTLRFQDATAGLYNPLIDNVSVVSVPEPSIFGLASVALLACAGLRRKISG